VQPAPPQVIRLPPGGRRIEFTGHNMLQPAGPPAIRLQGRQLAIQDADEHRLVVELPEHAAGALEVDLGDGDVQTFELERGEPEETFDRWSAV
jgi:hypothetical protein